MEVQGGKILKIRPDQLHIYWPQIRDGIVEIKSRCPQEPWLIEDIYASLRAGWAHLHVGDGFLVTQDLTEDYTFRPILHVWLAYSKGGEYDMGEKYLRMIAAGRPIRFHSPRVGWSRIAKVIRTEYEL
jgi:hypothetical protein